MHILFSESKLCFILQAFLKLFCQSSSFDSESSRIKSIEVFSGIPILPYSYTFWFFSIIRWKMSFLRSLRNSSVSKKIGEFGEMLIAEPLDRYVCIIYIEKNQEDKLVFCNLIRIRISPTSQLIFLFKNESFNSWVLIPFSRYQLIHDVFPPF